MTKRNETRTTEQFYKEAQSYFSKLGLTDKLDDFMATDLVMSTIHEKHEALKEKVKDLVQDMPKATKRRGEELLEQITKREEIFGVEVKVNMMCNMTIVIMRMEDYVPVDENLANLFAKAFVDEADGKMLEMVKFYAEALTETLLDEVIEALRVPAGIPPEIVGFIEMLTGGGLGMDFGEFLDFLNELEDDEEDGEEDHSEENEVQDHEEHCDGTDTHNNENHNHSCSCGGKCGKKHVDGKCQCNKDKVER